ncbi:hypothetical protein HanPSC8_Chr01g0011191 [Helianthus annuus]|nr:hypothetical protein HanPSC8_Chr01g0011191 [Helianthus annuus]
MAWYRRSKLGFDTICRYFTSPKPPINQLNKLTSAYSNIPIRFPKTSPVIGTGYRYYYVDSRQVRHFKPRGFKRWIDNPRNALIVGSGIGVTMYFGNVETIPYTKRRHLVLLSKNTERTIGESQFQNMKAGLRGRYYPRCILKALGLG